MQFAILTIFRVYSSKHRLILKVLVLVTNTHSQKLFVKTESMPSSIHLDNENLFTFPFPLYACNFSFSLLSLGTCLPYIS